MLYSYNWLNCLCTTKPLPTYNYMANVTSSLECIMFHTSPY